LSEKEIEHFALASAYLGALFEKKQEDKVEKIIANSFKASEKSQLDLDICIIWVELSFTNRSDRSGKGTSASAGSGNSSARGGSGSGNSSARGGSGSGARAGRSSK
jgi:uncharacterized membrane protein